MHKIRSAGLKSKLFLCEAKTASTQSLHKGEKHEGRSALLTADVRKQVTDPAAHRSVKC